jgi:hypothetical protein
MCFNCDEPYVRGHHCKRLFYLESSDFDMEDGAVDAAPNAKPDDNLPPQDVTTATACVVSLHALEGIRTENTMIMLVVLKGVRFLALLDTGSTHNFLQGAAMARLGLTPLNGDQLRVTVANGDRLRCAGIARHVPISIAGDEYTITWVDIDLGCFDFLRTLGDITWNLETVTLAFQCDVRRIVWNGVQGKEATCTTTPTTVVAVAEPQQPLLDRLLQEHSAIFEEPRGLPPARPYDHRIHLLSGTAFVVVRLYRYPQLQKDELEHQCAAMLAQGIIRPSTSPFSALMLLVRKADKTWRFCINYRSLNAKTSKDKFSISMVDELHGAHFFTKLDLRSGYHQVRMWPDDIANTAFHTHHSHYEFLVMPFSLSNAPATFQALMNDVLRPLPEAICLGIF